jgi:ferritin-like metal-binding protein YciE
MKVGGAGFVLFAKSQPDTPGKLTANAYSFEHLELASYRLLLRRRAGG